MSGKEILVRRGEKWRLVTDQPLDRVTTLDLDRVLSGVELPKTLRDATLVLLEGLTPQDRELLELASIQGPRFNVSLLAEIQRIDQPTVLKILDGLDRRGVIRQVSVVRRSVGGSYSGPSSAHVSPPSVERARCTWKSTLSNALPSTNVANSSFSESTTTDGKYACTLHRCGLGLR